MKTTTTIFTGALLLAAAGALSAESCGGDCCIDRFTIASGGVILAGDGNTYQRWQPMAAAVLALSAQ